MSNEKEKRKEEYELHVQWLDNGVVLAEPYCDLIVCEKFSDENKYEDLAMHKLFGQNLWADIWSFYESTPASQIKVTITIEEE